MNPSDSPPRPAVSLRSLRLSLGAGEARVDILRDLSLDLPAGRSIAILGPSGCGKSTLLMAAAGMEPVDSGEIEILGQRLDRMDEDRRAAFRARHIGVVFQSFHLMPALTALENVALPLDLAGAPDSFARARAALGQVGLGARESHTPATMSGGEQQRVALARALVARPALVLADEPTGNLDAATGEKIFDLLFETTRASGATLVLVTHDRDLAARCDLRAHIADGRVARVEPANAERANAESGR